MKAVSTIFAFLAPKCGWQGRGAHSEICLSHWMGQEWEGTGDHKNSRTALVKQIGVVGFPWWMIGS